MAVSAAAQPAAEALHPGDRVLVLDAPKWCRRYFAGREGRVTRVLPFDSGDVWVRFERPVDPWCDRMDPVEEFPFAPGQLVLNGPVRVAA